MSKYQLMYTEIKMKQFNKKERIRDFVYGKKTKVHQVIQLTEKIDSKTYNLIDYFNWIQK